jgi:hypothetical protein
MLRVKKLLNAQIQKEEAILLKGVKWQQERSYSEEEVLEIIHNLT